ncbi:MAG: 1-acyl-sn-glycerol-3-phosphate acyltransferase [Candidatus Ancillula sp.]|jgi:1-acyl-sn-glycerol-3-phosphate acyltransferase|nr:1-acyl-sn-glycerol-3-phosphate acyltransferase [Candidatus Ancillula sp.]
MLYHVLTKTIGLFARLYFRAFTKNRCNIPKKGAAILASNHLAVIDSFVLPIVVWRKIWFIGKKEYFRNDTIKNKLIKFFFTSVSVYPVDRNGGKAAEEALNVGRNALDSGNLFGIYPEGTRSPDGHLYKGRTGISKLALEKRVPVIPVAMIGTREAQKPGQSIAYPKKCGAVFGEPLHFDEFYDSYAQAVADNRDQDVYKMIRYAADEIMRGIWKVSDQTYVDIYATDAKKLIETGIDIEEYALKNNIQIQRKQ